MNAVRSRSSASLSSCYASDCALQSLRPPPASMSSLEAIAALPDQKVKIEKYTEALHAALSSGAADCKAFVEHSTRTRAMSGLSGSDLLAARV